jgi:hypothetical protein
MGWMDVPVGKPLASTPAAPPCRGGCRVACRLTCVNAPPASPRRFGEPRRSSPCVLGRAETGRLCPPAEDASRRSLAALRRSASAVARVGKASVFAVRHDSEAGSPRTAGSARRKSMCDPAKGEHDHTRQSQWNGHLGHRSRRISLRTQRFHWNCRARRRQC